MISSADGNMPAAIMSLTVWPAACGESNAASNVCTTSGRLTMRKMTFVATPSVPSDPTKTPVDRIPASQALRSQAGQVRRWATPLPAPSVCVTVKPYFRQCAPPEFSATFPPMVQTDCDEGSGA